MVIGEKMMAIVGELPSDPLTPKSFSLARMLTAKARVAEVKDKLRIRKS